MKPSQPFQLYPGIYEVEADGPITNGAKVKFSFTSGMNPEPIRVAGHKQNKRDRLDWIWNKERGKWLARDVWGFGIWVSVGEERTGRGRLEPMIRESLKTKRNLWLTDRKEYERRYADDLVSDSGGPPRKLPRVTICYICQWRRDNYGEPRSTFSNIVSSGQCSECGSTFNTSLNKLRERAEAHSNYCKGQFHSHSRRCVDCNMEDGDIRDAHEWGIAQNLHLYAASRPEPSFTCDHVNYIHEERQCMDCGMTDRELEARGPNERLRLRKQWAEFGSNGYAVLPADVKIEWIPPTNPYIEPCVILDGPTRLRLPRILYRALRWCNPRFLWWGRRRALEGTYRWNDPKLWSVTR